MDHGGQWWSSGWECKEVLANPVPLRLVKFALMKPFVCVCRECHDEKFPMQKFYDLSLCSRQFVNKSSEVELTSCGDFI